MVAVLDYNNSPAPRLAPSHLRLVPAVVPGDGVSSSSLARPALIAVPAWLDSRAIVVLAALFFALASLMVLQPGPSADHPLGTTGLPALSVQPAAGETVVMVEAGDTIWGIAEVLANGSDVRPIVAALVARNGGDSIRPGQLVVVPAEFG